MKENNNKYAKELHNLKNEKNKYDNTILELIKNIIDEINSINIILKIEKDNKLNNIKIENIDNISNVINEELKRIKNYINNNKMENKIEMIKNNEYKDTINIKYFTKKKGIYKIFGKNFVKNNINNINLIINNKENKLTNLEDMFYKCISLQNIDELKYLDTKNINNFRCMFN